MNTATTIFTVVLALIALVSAMGKLRKMPQVIESLTHVGLKSNQIQLLAVLEILGAIGLLIGIAYPLLVFVSAGALMLYFVGAVVAHLRVKDKFKDFAPALFLAVLFGYLAYLVPTGF
jgi:uncharacterized membrane protein YphA (DoxX/SURF4 family)